jgi:hypothetical protein
MVDIQVHVEAEVRYNHDLWRENLAIWNLHIPDVNTHGISFLLIAEVSWPVRHQTLLKIFHLWMLQQGGNSFHGDGDLQKNLVLGLVVLGLVIPVDMGTEQEVSKNNMDMADMEERSESLEVGHGDHLFPTLATAVFPLQSYMGYLSAVLRRMKVLIFQMEVEDNNSEEDIQGGILGILAWNVLDRLSLQHHAALELLAFPFFLVDEVCKACAHMDSALVDFESSHEFADNQDNFWPNLCEIRARLQGEEVSADSYRTVLEGHCNMASVNMAEVSSQNPLVYNLRVSVVIQGDIRQAVHSNTVLVGTEDNDHLVLVQARPHVGGEDTSVELAWGICNGEQDKEGELQHFHNAQAVGATFSKELQVPQLDSNWSNWDQEDAQLFIIYLRCLCISATFRLLAFLGDLGFRFVLGTKVIFYLPSQSNFLSNSNFQSLFSKASRQCSGSFHSWKFFSWIHIVWIGYN